MASNADVTPPKSQLKNVSTLPRHVAIIMDGNGRWATFKGLPRVEGHRKGLQTLREIVKHAVKRQIEILTLYSFSSENWQRPTDEVSFLLGLLRHFVDQDLNELHSANIRIQVIGERENLADDILQLLLKAENLTEQNTGMSLVVAFNYGGRNEIVRSIQQIVAEVVENGVKVKDICEHYVSNKLDTCDLPDPDLIIRTSGEKRLSNFLLWQAAYAEFVFRDELWPDFTPAVFDEAIVDYQNRERRFGGTGKMIDG